MQKTASQVALEVKNPPAKAGDIRYSGSIPGLGSSPGGEHGSSEHTQVFLPGESHGQRSLAGNSPRGRKDLDTTEAAYHTQCIRRLF